MVEEGSGEATLGLDSADNGIVREQWYDQLTPVQRGRLRTAVGLILDYLLDQAAQGAKGELQDGAPKDMDDDRQAFLEPHDGVCEVEAGVAVQPPLPMFAAGDTSSGE